MVAATISKRQLSISPIQNLPRVPQQKQINVSIRRHPPGVSSLCFSQIRGRRLKKGMGMGSRLKMFFCLLFTFALVSSARLSISTPAVSGEEAVWSVKGRSLMSVRLDDYGEASANKGHDPPSARKKGQGNGRKGL
ncbi:hypothetical protein SLEP1_g6999 [Rubroshorea leprosula]|uniref:Uncharacterized protein n=1 Tax=Rubroshorea leprosula TaxID=152421 RepID=A0AAV5I2U4_9ROSI|nr:hypothetical protein SLEP1_g6999 [Rubroshorea leprosula]